MEVKPRIIATVINDVVYDQRMIRICTSLSKHYNVELWGRRKGSEAAVQRPFKQRRIRFIIKRGPLFYLVYNLRLLCLLLFKKYDVVHTVDLDTLPAGFIATRLRGKKLVYDSHEYFTEVPELIETPFKRKIWLWLERKVVPKSKYNITVGSMIAKEYKHKYNVTFNVVRNAPSYTKTESSKPSSEPFFLYQGALNKGRGIEAVIRAMSRVNAKFKIAGRGDIEQNLYSLVSTLQLENKVEFLGLLEPGELKEVTKTAFAGINVSENMGLSYYYSLNNKFFDYLHAEIPAITNNFPEYVALNKEIECSLLATAQEENIASCMNRLLNDKVLYYRLKGNCIKAKKHWCWENEEVELLNLYSKIFA